LEGVEVSEVQRGHVRVVGQARARVAACLNVRAAGESNSGRHATNARHGPLRSLVYLLASPTCVTTSAPEIMGTVDVVKTA